mgnify:CR=1 FL=1
MEAVAETSEEFMERYFNGDEFSVEEIRAAMRTEVMDGDIVPVAMGSNLQAQGVANLLSDIVRFFPSPDKRSCVGINRRTNEIFEANYDFAKSKTAYVFKTMVDPFIGKYSFVKVCSGVLKGDDVLYNADTDAEEKPGKLYTLCGNKPSEVSELFAGDIGAIAKLTNTRTGDTLSVKNNPVSYARTDFSVPYTYMKYRVKNKGDEDKVSQALARMTAEDVTLRTVNAARTGNHFCMVWANSIWRLWQVSLHQDIRWRSHWRLRRLLSERRSAKIQMWIPNIKSRAEVMDSTVMLR